MPNLTWTVLSDFSTRFCCGGVGTRCLEEILMISRQSWMGGTRMPWPSPSWLRRVWWFIGHLRITPWRRSHTWIHPLSILICICLERLSTLLKKAAPGGKWNDEFHSPISLKSAYSSLSPLSLLKPTFPALWLTCLSSTQIWLLHITQFSISILCLPASSCFTSSPGHCSLSAWSHPFIAAAEVRTLNTKTGRFSFAWLQFLLKTADCSVSWHWSSDKILGYWAVPWMLVIRKRCDSACNADPARQESCSCPSTPCVPM